MATRKISDLTLLTTVSPSDTLLLLDNSDPVDTNKKSEVGSIFKAVPGGSQNQPGYHLTRRQRLDYIQQLKVNLVYH